MNEAPEKILDAFLIIFEGLPAEQRKEILYPGILNFMQNIAVNREKGQHYLIKILKLLPPEDRLAPLLISTDFRKIYLIIDWVIPDINSYQEQKDLISKLQKEKVLTETQLTELTHYLEARQINYKHGMKLSIPIHNSWSEFAKFREDLWEYSTRVLENFVADLQNFTLNLPNESKSYLIYKIISEIFSKKLLEPGFFSYRESLIKAYNNQEPIVFSACWFGHNVEIACYGQQLILGNRGEGMKENVGATIYNLKRPITLTDIENLTNCDSQQQFFIELHSLIDEKPCVNFNAKGHKFGTCKQASKKAVLQPLFILLKLKMEGEFNLISEASVTKADKEEAYQLYKKFTMSLRMESIKELVDLSNDSLSLASDEAILMLREYLITLLESTEPNTPPLFFRKTLSNAKLNLITYALKNLSQDAFDKLIDPVNSTIRDNWNTIRDSGSNDSLGRKLLI